MTDGRYLYWTNSQDKSVYNYELENQKHHPWKVVDTGTKKCTKKLKNLLLGNIKQLSGH